MTIEQIQQHVPTLPADALPAVAPASGYSLIRETAQAMADANLIAKAIANTEMVPKCFRGKPDDLTAAILYGATLGFDPMQSARQVYVVHGQAGLYARSMAALILSAGHQVWTVESTDDAVTVSGRRRGVEQVETATWTIDRAKKAGYTSNEKYRTDPQGMLYAKALSEVCRKIAPDVLNGVYAVEELEMERWEERPAAAAPSTSADRLRAALHVEQVPNDPAPTPAADPEPEPITSAQQKKIGAAMRDLGITERDNALLYVGDVIGREIGSRNELTKVEAGLVIEALERDLAAATQDGAQ